MKKTDGKYYVEVKDYRYNIHPTGVFLLRKRKEPKSVKTDYQVQIETQNRKIQIVIQNENYQLEVKRYPERKNKRIQKLNFQLLPCPSCRSQS